MDKKAVMGIMAAIIYAEEVYAYHALCSKQQDSSTPECIELNIKEIIDEAVCDAGFIMDSVDDWVDS